MNKQNHLRVSEGWICTNDFIGTVIINRIQGWAAFACCSLLLDRFHPSAMYLGSEM